MKTADDILKTIQFDLKHHRRLSEDSLEAISQFKADGRGEDKPADVSDEAIDSLLWRYLTDRSSEVVRKEQFRSKIRKLFKPKPSPLKPISESKGEAGEKIENEIVKLKIGLATFSRKWPTAPGGRKYFYSLDEVNAVFDKIPGLLSSLRSSEPETNPTFEQAVSYLNKPNRITVSLLRDLERKVLDGKITYSKMVELLNHRAFSEPEREGFYEFLKKRADEWWDETDESRYRRIELLFITREFLDRCKPSPPLKPLSEITDEDAIEVARMSYYDPSDDYNFALRRGKAVANKLNGVDDNIIVDYDMDDAIKIYQYLQHKGYEVPVFYPVPEVKEKGEKNE